MVAVWFIDLGVDKPIRPSTELSYTRVGLGKCNSFGGPAGRISRLEERTPICRSKAAVTNVT